MRINSIESLSFGNKKFRLPVKIVKPADFISQRMSSYKRQIQVPGNYVREYSNPKAEEYYIKAQNAKTIDEMLKYYDAMGDYKIINIEKEKIINNFLNDLDVLG